MIYALVVMLVCILVIAYVASGQDLLSPWVIATASFLNSATLAMLNLNYWQYGFHLNTCLVIVMALLCFGMGAMMAGRTFFRPAGGFLRISPEAPLRMPLLAPFLAAAVVLVLAGVSFHSLYLLSVSHGNVDGYAGMLPIIRKLFERKELIMPRWQSYRLAFAYATAILFLSSYLFNLVYFGFKRAPLSYLLPVVAFVPHIILTTGRIDFLKITLIGILVGGCLYQLKNGCSFRNNLRIVGCAVVAFGIFFGAFFAAGSLTWKGLSAEHGAFYIISHYTGAQIPAFDVFLNGKGYPENTLIGQMTLIGFYGNLRTLGFDLPAGSTFLEFTYFANVDTNVYTPLRAYIQDYGYVGMGMVSFLLGLLCTLFYRAIQHGRVGFLGLMCYAATCWPLFLFGHGETFFSGILLTYTVYVLLVLVVLYSGLRHYNPMLRRKLLNLGKV